MKRNWIILFCSIVVLSSAVYHAGLVGFQTNYRYAFLVFSDVFVAQIGIVDPNNLAAAPEYRDLGFPGDWRTPAVSVVSPDGAWVVFITSSRTGDPRELRFIRLMNFTSGEIRDLEPGHYLVGDAGLTQGISWSPDSQSLALNILQQTSDIFIYFLSHREIINLTNDGAFHPYFSWSPDSTKLAILTEICPTTENCARWFEVVSLTGSNRQTSPNLVQIAPLTGGVGCNLDWSPDGRYVSFVVGCLASVEVAREVFVWDTLQAELKQVTNFTVGAYQPGGTHFSQGFFVPAWYDADTLLIGLNYRTEFDKPTTQETYFYKMSTNKVESLFAGTVEQWARNLTSGQMAARIVATDHALNSQSTSAGGAVKGAVGIFTLHGSAHAESAATVNMRRDFPLGCDLAWSPDGVTLSYTVRESDNCLGIIQQIIFIEGATGVAQEYTPLLESGEAPYAILPIGWVDG